MHCKLGLIGGSGLDDPAFFTNAQHHTVTTRWGEPSSALQEGTIQGVPVVFLARHGKGHAITPSKVNYRANIQALQDAGCTHILATTAVGSLREAIQRGDLIIIDQFIDFTKQRHMTFFDDFSQGVVHTGMADPFDATLRTALIASCERLGIAFHPAGTVVTIEGPRFSTRAESTMFRQWGADIINMSIATEAVLANEAGLPYAAVGMSTDYDCWKEDEASVTWEAIAEVFRRNVDTVTRLLTDVIPAIAADVNSRQRER